MLPMLVSPEQYAAAQIKARTAAIKGLTLFLLENPEATRVEVLGEVRFLAREYGRPLALIACDFYMSEREALGINDGWQILPSWGYSLEKCNRLFGEAYDEALPLRGLADFLSGAVDVFGQRTLQRQRGAFDGESSPRPTSG